VHRTRLLVQLTTLLSVGAFGGFNCANAPDARYRAEITGPGRLPLACDLPECAMASEFSTIDAAVFAGFEQIRQHPDSRGREYGGCVWEERSGIYRASWPVPKTKDVEGSRHQCMTPPAPRGRQLVAAYHNHPTKERFSKWDVPARVPQYLLAPSGQFYRYAPRWTFEKWENGRWTPSQDVVPEG
jgi:hypothetical protein